MKTPRPNRRDWFSPYNLRRAFKAFFLSVFVLNCLAFLLWVTLGQTYYHTGQVVDRHVITNDDQSVTFMFVVNEDGGGLTQWRVAVSQVTYVTTPTFTKVRIRTRSGPFFPHWPPELVAR